jgi:transcriptional regulator with XRE-family HTH domain
MAVKDDATHRRTPGVLSVVGIRARQRREELGLTLREVALNAGLSVPYIANLEKARGNPTLDTLVRLSEALDVPLAEMLR